MIRFISILCACAAVTLGALHVHAQTAPAGNEHAREQALAQDDAANPFGEPGPNSFDTPKKAAFSKAVDLKPLRDLALYHSGRIKILDTLARETVQTLMGRKNYYDLETKDGKATTKVAYDPLFTYLDLVIDPAYYVDRPLIHVEFLPLREEFLDRMYTDKDEREWWKRAGRLKPLRLSEHLQAVEEKVGFQPGYREGLDEIRSSLLLYKDSHRNLLMVAAPNADDPWRHLSTLPADSALAKAFKDFGVAWRAGDAPKVNALAQTIAVELPKINAQSYPTTRRSLEAAYNRVNAFEWGYWFYAFALVSLLLAFGTGRKWLSILGITFLAIAMSMHAFGFISRCIIAERFAIQNQFESMTGVSLFATLVGLGLMLVRRQLLFGAAAAGVGFMILITATQTGIPGVRVEREAAILNTSVLLKYHVTTVLVSYGLIALGFMVSLFYIGTHYAVKGRAARASSGVMLAGVGADGSALVGASASALNLDDGSESDGAPKAGAARVLHDLDKAQLIVLQLAFWTLGVGILLGAWWADHSWGRWWAFDPKELWALVTWLVYLIVIHVRLMHLKDRGLTTAWLSVLGFVVMLWTYFGVNLLLPGLHAYA
jgi:cytochrome c-type biogenesis protein CcsB